MAIFKKHIPPGVPAESLYTGNDSDEDIEEVKSSLFERLFDLVFRRDSTNDGTTYAETLDKQIKRVRERLENIDKV